MPALHTNLSATPAETVPDGSQLCVMATESHLEMRGRRWSGRFTIDEQRFRVSLKLKIEGGRPGSLRDAGDVMFEMSRAKARARLDEAVRHYEQEITAGRTPSCRDLKPPKPVKRYPPLKLEEIPVEWRRYYAEVPAERRDSRKRRVKRARNKRYLDQVEAMLGRLVAYVKAEYSKVYRADDITAEMVDAHLLDRWQMKLGTPASYNKVLTALRGGLGLLVQNRRMRANPAAEIVPMDEESGDAVKHKTFKPEQVEQFLATAKASAEARVKPKRGEAGYQVDFGLIHALIRIIMSTGSRKINACTLDWSNVNWEKQTIKIQAAKRGALVEIPIFPPLMELILEAAKEYDAAHSNGTSTSNPGPIASPTGTAGLGNIRAGAIFPGLAAQYATNPDLLNDWFYRLCRMCGLTNENLFTVSKAKPKEKKKDEEQKKKKEEQNEKDEEQNALESPQPPPSEPEDPMKHPGRRRAASLLGVQSLRTTFITLAIEGGIPIPTIQSITGHKTEAVILQHYNESRPERLLVTFNTKAPSVITGATTSAKGQAPGVADARDDIIRHLRKLDPEDGLHPRAVAAARKHLLSVAVRLDGDQVRKEKVTGWLEILDLSNLCEVKDTVLHLLGAS